MRKVKVSPNIVSGMILFLFAVFVAVVFIPSESDRMVSASSDLTAVYLFILEDKAEHNGKNPKSLEELISWMSSSVPSRRTAKNIEEAYKKGFIKFTPTSNEEDVPMIVWDNSHWKLVLHPQGGVSRDRSRD